MEDFLSTSSSARFSDYSSKRNISFNTPKALTPLTLLPHINSNELIVRMAGELLFLSVETLDR